MIKYLSSIFILTLFSLTLTAQITLSDMFEDYTYYAKGTPGFNFLKDGRHYTLNERTKIVEYDLVSGKETGVVFDAENHPEIDRITRYEFSPSEKQILISTNPQIIYRHSYLADFFIYDRSSKKLTALHSDKKVRDPLFSPDGTMVAFSVDNNLYYKELGSGKIVQITSDGVEDKIINGTSDWVYEEEFAITRLYDWSADSKRIAFIRSDETEVPQFTMEWYNDDTYPEYDTFKYPKVGEKNSEVSLHIYHLGQKKTITPAVAELDDNYLPRLLWTKDANQLCLTWINRHQNHLKLILVDGNSGQTKTLLEEKNKYYIDIHDNITFLDDKRHFTWTSEKDGFNHIYLYDISGKEIAQITKGKFDVTSFYGVDEKNKLIFYQAAKKSPLKREVYRVSYTGKDDTAIEQQSGWNSVNFSGNYDYYVLNHSTANVPPVYTVHDRSGKSIRTIEDNKELVEKLKKEKFRPLEFLTIPAADGTELNAYVIFPPNFSESNQYPLFMTQYGGPGSQQVMDRWTGGNMVWYQMLAQKGYVIACVDNRGTGARGEEFKKQTYLRLGEMETADQIAAAKHLGQKSYIDEDRIGIFGWSYGGYMSSNCILHGSDVFKAAIAIAPVTNWKWYDSIYTERYMRTLKENEEGYRAFSPIYFVDQLKGDYFIAHGLADDNVHFQNTAEMVRALVEAGKDFETMFYPNNHHGISGKGARMHLYKKMTTFLDKSLEPGK